MDQECNHAMSLSHWCLDHKGIPYIGLFCCDSTHNPASNSNVVHEMKETDSVGTYTSDPIQPEYNSCDYNIQSYMQQLYHGPISTAKCSTTNTARPTTAPLWACILTPLLLRPPGRGWTAGPRRWGSATTPQGCHGPGQPASSQR